VATEYAIWSALRRGLPEVHWQRIEGIRGVPDVTGCVAGREFWIEGKALRGNRLRFERGQVAWMIAATRARRRCWILTRSGNDWILHHGADALRLSRESFDAVEPVLVLSGPRRDYRRLLSALTSDCGFVGDG
jgi:hypothetical protein